MVLRLFFVLLVALNVAVGAWLLLGQPTRHPAAPVSADPGVPTLRLLSELPPSAQTAHAAASAASVAPPAVAASIASADKAPAATPVATKPLPAPIASSPAPAHPLLTTTPPQNALSYACMAIGPFASQEDLRIARTALSGQVRRSRARQEETTQMRGWWVHLPAAASHAAALAEARQLGAKNIQDYFVVVAGDNQNTVSLGLFKDPANAHKRHDEVAAAGFQSVISERTETSAEYWLDLMPNDSAHFDWRGKLHDPGIGSHSTGCF